MALRQTQSFYDYRTNRRQTDATIEPITMRELKNHLRIPLDQDGEDGYLYDLIRTARRYLEDKTNIAFTSQTWKMTLDHWPGYQEPWWDGTRDGAIDTLFTGARAKDIIIPIRPLISVDTITVYDETGLSTAVTISTVFNVDTYSQPGRLTLKSGQTWPIATQANNAIEIDYTAGYGTSETDVPVTLQRAVLETAAYLYTHRGEGCDAETAARKSGGLEVLRPYLDVKI